MEESGLICSHGATTGSGLYGGAADYLTFSSAFSTLYYFRPTQSHNNIHSVIIRQAAKLQTNTIGCFKYQAKIDIDFLLLQKNA